VIRLAVRAPAEAAEPVLAALLDLAPQGLEQVDGPGWTEYALYGEPGKLPLEPGSRQMAGARVDVSAREVPDDWAERWRSFHRPVLVGGRLWVRPPWEPPRPGALDLVIDPGRAFGTGAHPTTRACLELLLELEPEGSLADLGCGSGVLAVAAARLGWAPVLACDAETEAVEATRENAERNGIALARVEACDLRVAPLPAAGVVVANLTGPLLLELAGSLRAAAGRALVVSGLLEAEAGAVARALRPLRERRRVVRDGWAALSLEPSAVARPTLGG
jgi:ribosomal protein L11 methyltransferase